MTVPSQANAASPPRRRPWWVYPLGAVGALAFLGFALLLGAWIYWLSLIRTFTSEKASTVPQTDAVEERFEALKERWEAYAKQFIHRGDSISPFTLSAEEINSFAARLGPLRNQAFVEITPPHLKVTFSVPLDRTGNPRLQGRFLNGVAILSPSYTSHQLDLRLVSLRANGKPIPAWILRRLQQTNWGEPLNRRPEFDLAFRALDRIELGTGQVVLHANP